MEPTTISAVVLGTAFGVEGVKFLWKQADTILNRYNERKYKQTTESGKPVEPGPVTIQMENPPAFLEPPLPMTVDFDRVSEKAAKLAVLSESLEPYVKSAKPVEMPDEHLKNSMDALQSILEYIFHNRFRTDETRARNIVEAIGGGRIEMDENEQSAETSGENIVRSEGSVVKIGKNRQKT